MPRFPENKCFGIFVPMNRSASPFNPFFTIFFLKALCAMFFNLLFIATSFIPISSRLGFELLRPLDRDSDCNLMRFLAGCDNDLERPLVLVKCACWN